MQRPGHPDGIASTREGSHTSRAVYGDLIGRTRALVAEHPDLPAPVREVVDGLVFQLQMMTDFETVVEITQRQLLEAD